MTASNKKIINKLIFVCLGLLLGFFLYKGELQPTQVIYIISPILVIISFVFIYDYLTKKK